MVKMFVFMLLRKGRLNAIEGSNLTIPIQSTIMDLLDLLEVRTTTVMALDSISNFSTISILFFVAFAQFILLTFGNRGGNP
ncbi:hypothetical protein L596_025154 [Steinernema carpocapsae]|uniref:Uncharacterized protein n=1 Tax=Steinernema carpocapsae TaxID=34508 RepID=A0A4U5M6Z0_STECR|nr:hypothetical protein L596_025154 [Steinernema carpocapsae]